MKYRIPAFLALAVVLHAAVLAAVVGNAWSGRLTESAAPFVAILIGPTDAAPGAAASPSADPVVQPAQTSAAPPETLRPASPSVRALASESRPVQQAARPASSEPVVTASPATFATPTPSNAAAPAANSIASAISVPTGDSPAPTLQQPIAASKPASGEGELLPAPPAGPAPRRTEPRVDASWQGNTPPAYPLRARRSGEQGEVLLDVHVDESGRVTEIVLKRSSGSGMLDRAAISAVRDWRFQPATIGGEPVADWYRDWRWVFRLAG
jgi:protein TonB